MQRVVDVPDGKYLLQITLFSTSLINASTISVCIQCLLRGLCPRGHICPFCFLVPNKCILIIINTGIGGKNMRFPISQVCMYTVCFKTFLSSRLHARDEVCPRHCSKFPPIPTYTYMWCSRLLRRSKVINNNSIHTRRPTWLDFFGVLFVVDWWQ